MRALPNVDLPGRPFDTLGMSSLVRSWVACGVLAFVANAAVSPAIARAQAPSLPPPGAAAPQPAPYPPAPYGYPPPGYAPAPQYPGYAPYPVYAQPQPVTVHKPRRGLVTGGAITFGVSWGIAASVSLLLNDDGCTGGCAAVSNYLWIPVAGPAIVAARDTSSGGDSLLILWSAAQAAGAAMLIVGLVGRDVTEYRYVRNGVSLQLTPLLARSASGMALTARW
jgi:hypothetical protein